jgi:hypothetical protein
MAVVYGWTYAEFQAQVDAYIFTGSGTHLTDANEIAEIATIVNSKMILTNLYLKGEQNESPMGSGFYSNPGFPIFAGYPEDNNGIGSGDYIILNKYKREKSQEFARGDSIRVGVDPDIPYFTHDRFYL